MTRNKLRTILLLLTVVSAVVIFINGHQEENRISSLNNSFSELYTDRLFAESCLFKMNDLLHEKQALLLSNSGKGAIKNEDRNQKRLTDKFTEGYSEFLETKLCAGERLIVVGLTPQIEHMKALERKNRNDPACQRNLLKTYTAILNKLDALSDIQVTEGLRITKNGHQTLAASLVGLKFDSAIYVIFLVSLLGLLRHFFLPTKLPAGHELN